MSNNTLPFDLPPPPYLDEPLPAYTPSDPTEPPHYDLTLLSPRPLRVGFSRSFPTSLEPPPRVSREIAVSERMLYTPPPVYSHTPSNMSPVDISAPRRQILRLLYTHGNDAHIDIRAHAQRQNLSEDIETCTCRECSGMGCSEFIAIVISVLVVIGVVVGIAVAVFELY
jgi:hypothetical protein